MILLVEKNRTAAIYIHFPFCRHLCTYCDFDTFAGLERLIPAYVDSLVRQIEQSPTVQATSLYLGGGTPSLMEPAQAARVMEACRRRFRLPPDAEAAIEANPSGLDATRLRGFRDAGFNRLSIGVQSTNPRLLRLLGRRHTAEDAAATVQAARQAGFRNLSVDLLYGVPMQDEATWRTTLEDVVSWGVEHVSAYMLTVEDGTPLERGVARGTLSLPPDDTVVEMYSLANRLLGDAGYRRYEISNWARPGFESSHNLTYWRNQEYLGIGAGAAGFWQGRRYKLRADVLSYVEGTKRGDLPLSEDEQQDARLAMSNTMILGLRLSEGVSRESFCARHGLSPEKAFGEVLDWAEKAGLLERSGELLRLTERGILLSNELFSRLV